ncbi:Nif3-like dinuclear metal center hexameric protein [Mycoplasma putrefaciens]|uniref:GTP cyclohydrolase 1 type 2 homolog n=1 Tax=Mycoplasma putrefaciens (strain ATCC 15718 / NCTC 10155 / C30 KS-1 / KS-1) TaxID=743965 RepID=A0A7U3ZSJ5_MYCPK|nr:Nif3-like dinuclear metal center hexameric protein [Mycoplasma putrefaciens]AEM68708.1 uncharacterized protein MPUT_0330 [Mycoplasma putrefaciens KS1]
MQLVNIISYLDKKFSPKKAGSWDNSGLQVFSKKTFQPDFEVNKILVCLDLTNSCLDYAIQHKVNLIISRHPFIFNELAKEKTNPIKKEMIKKLVKHQIVVFAIHSNYDASIYQSLTDLINQIQEVKKFKKFGNDHESNSFLFKNELKIVDLINKLAEIFNCDLIRFNCKLDLDQKTKRVYLTTGSGASTMIDQSLKDCVFITGEVKWNEWIYANDNHVSLIEIGHYMENYFVDDLKNKLDNKFNQLEVLTYDVKNQFVTWKKV